MGAHRVAVLIACKNGAGTIANSVRSAAGQADVYVVSDGSDDATAEVAEAAGATVFKRELSGGKPNALRAGNLAFDLASSYEYVAILDDDTTLEQGYLDKLTAKMDADETIAAASGRIDSVWDHARRWNPLIAMRAFMYWSYQSTIKRGQNALRVVNVICGANTVFRSDVFKRLIDEDAPYAIDDMYWLAEIVRRKLGRVAFVHDARSWTIDPHRLGDWYKQTVRWSWGQFQSVRGHRLGVPIQRDSSRHLGWGFSWFDAAYLALLIDWLSYSLEPLLIVPMAWWLARWFDPLWFLAVYLGTSLAWISVAACSLRKPRLVILAPAILALDLLYRLTMLHALIKTIHRPRIATCKWDSPARFDLKRPGQATAEPLTVTPTCGPVPWPPLRGRPTLAHLERLATGDVYREEIVHALQSHVDAFEPIPELFDELVLETFPELLGRTERAPDRTSAASPTAICKQIRTASRDSRTRDSRRRSFMHRLTMVHAVNIEPRQSLQGGRVH